MLFPEAGNNRHVGLLNGPDLVLSEGFLFCERDPGEYVGRHRLGSNWVWKVSGFRVNAGWR